MKIATTLLSAVALTSALPSSQAPSDLAKRSTDIFDIADKATGAFVSVLEALADKTESIAKKTIKKSHNKAAPFVGWNSFKSNGVDLGGWLSQEKGIDPAFFDDNGASAAIDEDSFCAVLGQKKCGKLLEQRYKEFITEDDIDIFASYGVNLVRVPLGYWAFMPAIKGDNYYTGKQLHYLSKIAKHAISKGMHVIVDLHGLPGGQSGLDNQGKTNQIDWWHNSTHMDQTLNLVGLATDFILAQSNSNQFTLSIINEPLPALYYFGQTDESMEYLNDFYGAALDLVRKKSATIPVMLADGFVGPQTWEKFPRWVHNKENIVFDAHIYFFTGGSYSYDAPYSACYLAKSYQVATNPVFIGEWSIQASNFNSADVQQRKLFFQSQFNAYNTYLSGGAVWNGKHRGAVVVGDDGSKQPEYWGWQTMAAEGVVPKVGEELIAATCE
jgi:aryl-phospho-beta-D-glucosidase BglC (GH1 family)